jgi:L-amino acid N-acyltransferase YncA
LSCDVEIRPSNEGDIAAIAAIYRYHVLHGLASFEEVPPEPAEIASRRREIVARGLPYLVAERTPRHTGCVRLIGSRWRIRFTSTRPKPVGVSVGRCSEASSTAAPNSAIAKWLRSSAAATPGRRSACTLR